MLLNVLHAKTGEGKQQGMKRRKSAVYWFSEEKERGGSRTGKMEAGSGA